MLICNINWNVVPMVFNDSFTYMEMLGKCVGQLEIVTPIVNDNKSNIEDLTTWKNQISPIVQNNTSSIRSAEGRISTLENKSTTAEENINTLGYNVGSLTIKVNSIDKKLATDVINTTDFFYDSGDISFEFVLPTTVFDYAIISFVYGGVTICGIITPAKPFYMTSINYFSGLASAPVEYFNYAVKVYSTETDYPSFMVDIIKNYNESVPEELRSETIDNVYVTYFNIGD